MENINIISLGNFKINNREFFKKILNANEIDRKKIRGIYGGEKIIYKNLKNDIKYINNHFIIDDLNFKEINNKIKIILNDRKNREKTLIFYFINQFDENNFNESIEIIKEFGESYKKNFCLIYIESKDNKIDKSFFKELNNIIELNKITVEGKDFYFNINENKRKEFEKILIDFYFNEKKRDILEEFSSFCIKKIYSSSMEKDRLTDEDIFKINKKFKLDLEKKIINNIDLFNKEINRTKKDFGVEYLSNVDLVKREDWKIAEFDKSTLGSMAKKINKKEEKTLKEKILIIFKFKKENVRKDNKLEKKLINEAFIQKKRIEKSLELNNNFIKI